MIQIIMSLEEKINQFREKYYSENKKAIFFKNSQKLDCAKEITQKFSVHELLNKSIYIDHDKIMVNYPLIKTFINPTIYSNILQHGEYLICVILSNYPYFEVHLDAQSFTVTAAQRYHNMIKEFLKSNKYRQYEEKLKHVYIMNPPNILSILKNMFHPFISDSTKNKIIIVK